MVALGIMGEYIARIHQEVRGRPLYITRERLGFRPLPRSAPNVIEFLPSDHATLQEETTVNRLGNEWVGSLAGK